MIYDFYIFVIDKSMFSLRICRYLMGKLMTEVLETVESVRFIPGPGIRPKNLPGVRDLTSFKNLLGVARGMVALGVD